MNIYWGDLHNHCGITYGLGSLENALEIVDGCVCENGCPSCVGPVLEVGELGKAHARAILKELLA